MEILQKNLETMELYRKGMKKYLLEPQIDLSQEPTFEVSFLPTKENTKALVIKTADQAVYRLNSTFFPTKEANRWCSQYDLKQIQKVFVMFGFGNGVFARELLSMLEKDEQLIVYEPSFSIFHKVVENEDISDLLGDSRFYLSVTGINEMDFEQYLYNYIAWINLGSVKVCIHPQYEKLFPKEFEAFKDSIRHNSDMALTNRNTAALMGVNTAENTLHNMKFLSQMNLITDYKEYIPEDVPAIIVSSGPSLDKNIDDLKAAMGKAVIFSADRSVDFLLKHGVVPDFTATVDAIKPVKFFNFDQNYEIPLLCRNESSKDIMDYHKGKKILFQYHPFIEKLLKSLDKKAMSLSTGGCVATSIFSCCLALGFKRIIFVGQDLAYAEGSHNSHVGGIKEIRKDRKDIMIYAYVKGIHEEKVATRHDWYMFLKWFEHSIDSFKEKIDFIDATEGGAYIEGTRLMTLKDAISEYCQTSFDVKAMIESTAPSLTKEQLSITKDYVQQAIYDVAKLKEKAKQSVEFCDKLMVECRKNNAESDRAVRLVRKISQNNKTIMDYPVYLLLDNLLAESATKHLRKIYQSTGDVQTDRSSTYEKSKIMYEELLEATDTILPVLDEALTYFTVPDYE